MESYHLSDSPAQTACPISKFGYPFIIASIFITVIFALLDIAFLSFMFLIITVFICFFFRDPDRLIPKRLSAIVSPADGSVVDVRVVDDCTCFIGKCHKISIFMSIFNVHVNRVPFDGVVKRIDYYPGFFFSANLDKASKKNERNVIILKINENFDICFVQIAGLLARRIICGIQPGDSLKKGQKFGLICFGSRLDVYIPCDIGVSICVTKGDKVSAGSSVIGELLDVS